MERRRGNLNQLGFKVRENVVLRRACEPEVTIPDPFGRTALSITYDDEIHPRSDLDMLQRMFSNHSKKVGEFSNDCEARKSLSRLMKDGLVVSHFGMDFTQVHKTRYANRSGKELATDRDVQRVRDIYYATRVNRFFWDVDVPFQYGLQQNMGYSAHEQELLASFRRDGFVKIDQWPGLDMMLIHQEAAPGLASSRLHVDELGAYHAFHGGSLLQGRMMGVEGPMLKPDSLMMKLARAYLGGEPKANTISAFNLPGNATKKGYSNAPWHHDGCGLRLKAWIYLEDVDEHTHPTLIAAGTHKNQWYPTNQFFVGKLGHNKLNESIVYKEFGSRITPMLGKKGGGFIFDTQCIHAASMKGVHKNRNAILIELSTLDHKQLMPRGSRGPDDGFMSGFTATLCPAPADR